MTEVSSFLDLLLLQLADPFRIGLVAALLVTTIRTSAATGWILPLSAGIFFVAYIIAMSFPVAGLSVWWVTASGVAANAILAGIMLVLWMAWRKVSKQ